MGEHAWKIDAGALGRDVELLLEELEKNGPRRLFQWFVWICPDNACGKFHAHSHLCTFCIFGAFTTFPLSSSIFSFLAPCLSHTHKHTQFVFYFCHFTM